MTSPPLFPSPRCVEQWRRCAVQWLPHAAVVAVGNGADDGEALAQQAGPIMAVAAAYSKPVSTHWW